MSLMSDTNKLKHLYLSFFVDLDPNDSDSDIFSISLCTRKSKLKNHTKSDKYHNAKTANPMATPAPTALTTLCVSNAVENTSLPPVQNLQIYRPNAPSAHPPATEFSSKPQPRSYATVTVGHLPPKPNPMSSNNNEVELLKFLNEFKAILNPLIVLLTTVLSNLTNINNAK